AYTGRAAPAARGNAALPRRRLSAGRLRGRGRVARGRFEWPLAPDPSTCSGAVLASAQIRPLAQRAVPTLVELAQVADLKLSALVEHLVPLVRTGICERHIAPVGDLSRIGAATGV